MAASIWRCTRHGSLKFQPKFCRYLRGRTFEPQLPRVRTVQEFLEDYPGFKSPKTIQGRHAGEFQTLDEVLKSLREKDAGLYEPVDIGMPNRYQESSKIKKSQRDHIRRLKSDPKLEKAARLRTLEIPLDDVQTEWEKTVGPQHIKTIAEHYGVFRDLFDGAYFLPQIPLHISYDYDDNVVTAVYRGNHIKPSEASKAPDVHFESEEDSLWTLILTNPDGHLKDNSSEYLHWFIGNIPGNCLKKGDVICDYMQPFPPKGTGYHRFIFVLYKQEKHIDYSKLKRTLPCLAERTFSTFDFYKERQDVLIPAGLAFFQSDWDESLKDFFHNILSMREPSFEYNFPPPDIRKQTPIPFKQPFNIYLDKYRDPKDIGQEMLLKRFKNIHPFKEDPPRPKYPNISPVPYKAPSWLKTEIFKERLRLGKYKGLDVEVFKPTRYTKPLLGIFSNRKKTENE